MKENGKPVKTVGASRSGAGRFEVRHKPAKKGQYVYEVALPPSEAVPEVHAVRFDGIETARPSPEVLVALESAEMLVIAPSNPVVSVEPILALSGIREAIQAAGAREIPRLAVSPIVAGAALKGPADRMLASLGHEASALGVARRYAGLIDAFVLDDADAALAPRVEEIGMRATVLPTVMRDDSDRAALASALLSA